ncbi:Phr family secreted Rap phosphatase inhibitor [Priestia taiwanensis]|uniref:Uncharacterized protein n=1 Tax=Priestia taiwanensis TaxID=1347902 RepID=A0A917ANJ7_9BACI|nr:Phr family secreted Rap phosphatase inhibitor [Priestia taiwanensis]MBM7362631.1 Phr family secreted Rap phosphatase inhibitor [Priestia taiwanensis]GGE63804.1 hypothetical protein GCM10007140_12560 [Priestia taiwanensis]
MKKIKLSVLGMISVAVLSLGLGVSAQTDSASVENNGVILFSSEHGKMI